MRQLELFNEGLPHKPYCTDSFQAGLLIRQKIHAIQKKYIQANPPHLCRWFVYDVDRAGGAYDWQFRDMPAPNFTVENPENRHAHLFYGLNTPVATHENSRSNPLRYAGAIQHAFTKSLDADINYTGLIAKNPNHKWWNVIPWHDSSYDLPWLADYVDLEPFKDRRRRLPDSGLGRNCNLFDRTRLWAYTAFRKVEYSHSEWSETVLFKASNYNGWFEIPLPYSEVKATARSVAKWTWRNQSLQGFQNWAENRRQKSIDVRQQKSQEKALKAQEMKVKGMKQKDIAEALGINQSQVSRLLKNMHL